MRIKILPSALRDLREGSDFYERQNPALGDYFLDSLFSDIDSLMLYAGIHRKVYGYHRVLSKRFPYAIYYAMDGLDLAVVYRVLDCRRNPSQTSDDLES